MTYQKVGGLHFMKLGRFTFMACRSKPRPTIRSKFRTSEDGVLVLGYTEEDPQRRCRSIMPREKRELATILALGVGVVAIGLFAIFMQMRAVTVPALAEDDCAMFHGTLAISEVVRTDPLSDHVNCIYR